MFINYSQAEAKLTLKGDITFRDVMVAKEFQGTTSQHTSRFEPYPDYGKNICCFSVTKRKNSYNSI